MDAKDRLYNAATQQFDECLEKYAEKIKNCLYGMIFHAYNEGKKDGKKEKQKEQSHKLPLDVPSFRISCPFCGHEWRSVKPFPNFCQRCGKDITNNAELKIRNIEEDDKFKRDGLYDDIFEAFRCCITDQKCNNKDCPYEGKCGIANGSGQYIQIPKHLALDVVNLIKRLQDEVDDLSFQLYG